MSDALSIELVAGGFPCPAFRTRLGIRAAHPRSRDRLRLCPQGPAARKTFSNVLLTSAQKAKKPSRALTLEGLMGRIRSPEALFLGPVLLPPLVKTRPAGINTGHAGSGGSLVSGRWFHDGVPVQGRRRINRVNRIVKSFDHTGANRAVKCRRCSGSSTIRKPRSALRLSATIPATSIR